MEDILDKAEAIGKAKGEKKAKLEMAKKMIIEGMPAEIVAKMTGLSVEEIEKVKIEKP